ncbi:MAG TPA: tetratricopeptide repeat protein [Gammaproteobacteria bacterium]|nr:tetratricopeptide repeat protein [Gammaproteobacteria bacterium]
MPRTPMTPEREKKLKLEKGSPIRRSSVSDAISNTYFTPQTQTPRSSNPDRKKEEVTPSHKLGIDYYNLALNHEEGNGVDKDLKRALHFYHLAADQRHPKAQNKLGLRYLRGDGVEKDLSKAVRLFQSSANQQDAEGQYQLGLCLLDGVGDLKKDSKAAISYLTRATQQQHKSALKKLIEILPNSHRDNPEELYKLAMCFEGGINVKKDIPEAMRLYKLAALKSAEGIHLHKLAAAHGDSAAECRLGKFYERGLGVEVDLKRAVKYYALAASHGNIEAQNHLGRCYYEGIGVAKDVKQAALIYEAIPHAELTPTSKINLGFYYLLNPKPNIRPRIFQLFSEASDYNYDAKLSLGFCYEKGIGIFQDRKAAIRYYTEVWEHGRQTEALHRLGYCYQQEAKAGKPNADLKAVEYYKQCCDNLSAEDDAEKIEEVCGQLLALATEHNSRPALEQLVDICLHKLTDRSKIYHYIQPAAGLGHALAQNKLGEWLEAGDPSINIVPDQKTARLYYQAAANRNNAKAMYNLARCYQHGIGGEKNQIIATAWYKDSANQGNTDAMYHFAHCLRQGRGIEKDISEALRWYWCAAEQSPGHAKAQNELALIYEQGNEVNKDIKEAIRLYKCAAGQGYPPAQYNLANCYAEGCGVTQDLKEAARLYQLAAEKGHTKSQFSLGICYEQGYGVEKDAKAAIGLYKLAADAGLDKAQYYLGKCYSTGVAEAELEKDPEEAKKYFKLSAEQGYTEAKKSLSKLTPGSLERFFRRSKKTPQPLPPKTQSSSLETTLKVSPTGIIDSGH